MDPKDLKKLEKKITPEMEKKWFPKFERQASFLGNGIYTIAGLYSIDTRELFVMFVCQKEGIKLPKNTEI